MNDGMCNICELLINVVIFVRPKMLTGLGQNGKRYGWIVPLLLHVINDPSDRQTDANPLRVTFFPIDSHCDQPIGNRRKNITICL
jgi:hypothetical protein